jgi:2-polyprenyl-6-methoxyphenol hydroxylase-like FAD-dependent oxidoreductase
MRAEAIPDRSGDAAPVTILGAGPAGLALANELSWRGTRCILIDRLTQPLDFPTSESIHARTMEHFRRWGIADDVRNAGFPLDMPRSVSFVTRLRGYDLGRVERPSNREQQGLSGKISPEGPIWCPKFLFEEVMRRRLRAAGTTELLFGCEVTGFTQDEAGIDISVHELATGRKFTLRSGYLAACDGASSGTRKALGIDFEGTFAEGRNLGIYLRSSALRDIMAARRGVMADIINADFSANISAVDGKDLWRLIVFMRDGDPGALDPLACVHKAVGSKIDVEILDARTWAGHTVVANRFRSGRVFLVGDAAHLLWPRGGFGMNTGVGDAVDLGWKLDAALRGWGGAGLLSSYEMERRPVAIRNVTEAAGNYRAEAALPISRLLDQPGPQGDAERLRTSQAILATRTREWNTIGLQLGYVYEGSPICRHEQEPVRETDGGSYVPTTRPGARAPHIWLSDRKSTLDHYGRGFCLVHRGGIDVGAFSTAASERHIPFSILHLAGTDQQVLYEKALVLVRPDGQVAWRSDELPADPGAILDMARGSARDVVDRRFQNPSGTPVFRKADS